MCLKARYETGGQNILVFSDGKGIIRLLRNGYFLHNATVYFPDDHCGKTDGEIKGDKTAEAARYNHKHKKKRIHEKDLLKICIVIYQSKDSTSFSAKKRMLRALNESKANLNAALTAAGKGIKKAAAYFAENKARMRVA